MEKRILLLVLIILFSLEVNAFVFQGYVVNKTNQFVEDVNVTMQDVYGSSKNSWSIQSDTDGFFKINTKGDEEGDIFKITVYKYKDISNVTFIAPTLFYPLPKYVINDELKNTNISIVDAVNMKIYANNVTDNVNFFGEIRDDSGLTINKFYDSSKSEVYAVVPKNINISIMIYQEGKIAPIITTLTNLTDYGDYAELNLTLNTNSYSLKGSADVSENTSAVGFTDYVILNADSNWKMAKGRIYVPLEYGLTKENGNTYEGEYNITLAQNTEYVILFLANNSNEYFGGFLNLSRFNSNQNINVTLNKLAGKYYEDSLVNTSFVNLNVSDGFSKKNNKGQNQVGDAFVVAEATYNNIKYSFSNIANENGVARFPLLFENSIFKIFSRAHSPRIKVVNVDELNVNNTVVVPLEKIENNNFDKKSFSNPLNLKIFTSSSSCDVPNPPNNCLLNSFSDVNSYSPMSNMQSEKISMRILQPDTGIVVHYINVNMILSGVPSASFDENSGVLKSKGSSSESWRVGSQSPDTYDSVLLGVPYSDNNINDSGIINITITNVYDDEFNSVWDTSVNGTDVASGIDEFADYDSRFFTGLDCDKNDINALCYVNISSNIVWIKVPHFSGIGPSIGGEAPGAGSSSSSSDTTSSNPTSSTTPSSTGSSGGGGGSSKIDVKNIRSGETGSLGTLTQSEEERLVEAGGVVEFRLGNKKYSVKVREIVENKKVVLEIKYVPGDGKLDDVEIEIGETKEISVDDNKYPEFKIIFKDIENNKAQLVFAKIGTIMFIKNKMEEITEEDGKLFDFGEGEITNLAEAGKEIGNLLKEGKIGEVVKKTPWWMWLMAVLFFISLFGGYEFVKKRYAKY